MPFPSAHSDVHVWIEQGDLRGLFAAIEHDQAVRNVCTMGHAIEAALRLRKETLVPDLLPHTAPDPLFRLACRSRRADLALMALERGAMPSCTLAAEAKLTVVVEACLAHGADPERGEILLDWHRRDAEVGRVNALMLATYEPSLVARLLDRGARVTSRDSEGWTPLHYASFRAPMVGSVRALLSAGADPNAVTPANLSPLHVAVAGNAREVVEMLVAHGAQKDLATTARAEIGDVDVKAGTTARTLAQRWKKTRPLESLLT